MVMYSIAIIRQHGKPRQTTMMMAIVTITIITLLQRKRCCGLCVVVMHALVCVCVVCVCCFIVYLPSFLCFSACCQFVLCMAFVCLELRVRRLRLPPLPRQHKSIYQQQARSNADMAQAYVSFLCCCQACLCNQRPGLPL